MNEQSESNLIENSYLLLLQLSPISGRRLELQSVLAALRESIAIERGCSSEQVQDAFEAAARLIAYPASR